MNDIISAIERRFTVFASLLLVALTIVLYQHALSSGFFLDDATSIRVEPLMLQPDILPLYEKFKLRFLGYLSFWVNYQISGEDPAAFRLVNFAIHAVNGLLVFVLSYRLFALSGDTESEKSTHRWVALLVAALFIAHPLQTQAVTYIVQRLASLMTLFYLAALISWVEVFRSRSLGVRAIWLILFASLFLASCYTKQNAFTLPFVLILMELLIFRRLTAKHWSAIGVIGLIFALVTVVFVPDFWATVDRLTRETPDITRWEYFTHQWVILWMYLGKVIWPYPQLLDYGVALNSFDTWVFVLAGLGHLVLLVLGLAMSRRFPLVTFGVLFFYAVHSVESGLIPIRDLVFEHRNYLPLFGVFFGAGAAIVAIVKHYPAGMKYIKWVSILVLLFFAQATWARNQMWADQEALLKADVVHNPENVRALYNLALWYQRNDRYDQSMETLKALVAANDGQLNLLHATTYVATLIDLQLYDLALNLLDKLLEAQMKPLARAAFLRQYGTVLTGKADDEAAVDVFEEAMQLAPMDYDSGLAYGYSLIQLGRLDEANILMLSLEQRFGSRTRLGMLRDVWENKAASQGEERSK